MKLTAKDLTLEEKLTLLTGKNSWQTEDLNGKIPNVFVADGPSGLRKMERTNVEDTNSPLYTRKATAMPTLSCLANSWDRELCYLDGKTIADDCIEADVDVLLAPGVNIKKTPLCGRNFEYFSEDPYLSGELAYSFIRGVEDKGVATSLKHFIANNREEEKLDQSNEIDQRTMFEIYLPAFERAVEAKPATVMCAYNAVNGVFSSENSVLLDDILRKKFGFDGVIVSDWNAVHNRYKALKATLDLQMPYSAKSFDNLKTAYENGFITDQEIDDCVNRLLNLVFSYKEKERKVDTDSNKRHQTAVKLARESMVLLKNQDNVLPLRRKKIAVGGSKPVIGGEGSSRVQTDYKIPTLAESIKAQMPETEIITFNDGTFPEYYNTHIHFKSGYLAAYEADLVVLTVSSGNLAEGEGYDRSSLKLPPRVEERIIRTAEINPNVVIVLYAGGAIDMSAWLDKVKGVVLAGLSGEGATEALAELLSGKACFNGKLSETFPQKIEDLPDYNYYADGFTEWYREGIFVGYRHYDKFKKEVLFPFGYGLSYAEFDYSDLKIQKISETEYDVSYTIHNNSDFSAKEISQVYVKDVFSMVMRPDKELKAFSKDLIPAKSSVTVKHRLTSRAFAYYSTLKKDWYVENGSFEILIGASSRDIKLKGRIDINLPDQTQQSVTK